MEARLQALYTIEPHGGAFGKTVLSIPRLVVFLPVGRLKVRLCGRSGSRRSTLQASLRKVVDRLGLWSLSKEVFNHAPPTRCISDILISQTSLMCNGVAGYRLPAQQQGVPCSSLDYALTSPPPTTGRGYEAKSVLCNTWKKRSEHPKVGGVSVRSRDSAPPRKGCVVNC